jgi:hypothetical protein
VKVAGIDVSTHSVDVVILPFRGSYADGAVWRRVEVPRLLDRRGAIANARTIRDGLESRVDWTDVLLAYIEKPFSQNRHTIAELSVVIGAIAASLPVVTVVNEISAQEWKRVFCDRADASKLDIREQGQSLGFVGPDLTENAYDAFGVAWSAREENRRALEIAGTAA